MKLSIITINYNNAAGLKKTLDSVAEQTWCEFEYIAVDGGSTDKSVEVIHTYFDLYEDKYSIKYVSEPDKGIFDAMNKGIKMASGEYCLFLNSGDCLYSDTVLEELFKHDWNADIISAHAFYEKTATKSEKIMTAPPSIINTGVLPHQSTLIKRELFDRIHMYDTSYQFIADWLFFLEALTVYRCSYQQINMILSLCEQDGVSNNVENTDKMKAELDRGYRELVPMFANTVDVGNAYRSIVNSEKYIFFEKFSHTLLGRALWKMRKSMKQVGYYKLKKSIKHRSFLRRLYKEDKLQKRQIEKEVYAINAKRFFDVESVEDIVCSVTSYGKRVKDALPYMLYSLLGQTMIPKKVVVYLDKDNWSDEELPAILKHFQEIGVEFCYVEDIRSFKKLIPALQMYPNNPIITLDDDFYYNPSIIEWLVKEYEASDKRTVIGSWANIPQKRNGKYLPYHEWMDCKYGNEQSEYALFAGNGTIYPPHIFDEEICDKDIFMNLCPTADDIWFWVMEKRLGIKTKLIKGAGFGLHRSINRIEEYDLTQKGTLFYQNVTQGKNDAQLRALIEYYKMENS